MKKCFILLSAISSAFLANAAYLYWQVDASDYTETFDTAVVKYYDPTTGNIDTATKAGTLESYRIASYDPATETATYDYSGAIGQQYTVDLDTLQNYSSYSYFIELQNSGSFVARTQETSAMTYTQLSADSHITVANLASTPALISAWHGGPYTPTPEPTSAILMLFGAAFLGLKRKNRSLA